MDQVSDPSFYYVCEKGQLYPPYSKRHRTFKSCTSRSLKRFQPDENNDSNYVVTMSDQLSSRVLVTEVVSLKSLVMSFVAQNILSVDSLASLPELIGKELFLEVSRLGLLRTPSKRCKLILRLFGDAYDSSVAEELSFGSKVSNLEFCFEPLTSFEHLTKLDLGGCKIWNLHDECLAFISSLSSLSYLSLKSTGIDNDGLRILTTVIAVYKKGLLQLKVLDLSCNQLINQQSLRFLHRFPALKALNLSNTNVFSISLEEEKNLRLILLKSDLVYPFEKISVTNKGWVAEVFNDWIAEEVRRVDDCRATYRSQPSLPVTTQDRFNAGMFYKRSKENLSYGLRKENSIHVDQASKLCMKFTSEACGIRAHKVHLVSAELIEEINGIERVKDLIDPSTGRAETESTPASETTVVLHSSGKKSLSGCVTKKDTENCSGESGNTSASSSLSTMRHELPDDAAFKFLQKVETNVRKPVSLDDKQPSSTHRKPVNRTESITGDCAHESKSKPKSLWVAMNSESW